MWCLIQDLLCLPLYVFKRFMGIMKLVIQHWLASTDLTIGYIITSRTFQHGVSLARLVGDTEESLQYLQLHLSWFSDDNSCNFELISIKNCSVYLWWKCFDQVWRNTWFVNGFQMITPVLLIKIRLILTA